MVLIPRKTLATVRDPGSCNRVACERGAVNRQCAAES